MSTRVIVTGGAGFIDTLLARRLLAKPVTIGDARSAPVDELLFATARELLTNVIKHAGASTVRIELAQEQAFARITQSTGATQRQMSDLEADLAALQRRVDEEHLEERRLELQRLEDQRFDSQRVEIQNVLESQLAVQSKLVKQGSYPAFLLAETSALLGRKRDALDDLDAAFQKRELYLVALPVVTTLVSLRIMP